MVLEQAVIDLLLARTGLTGLVEDRIEFDDVPQGAPTPYIVLYRITRGGLRTLKGRVGISGPIIQHDIVDTDKVRIRTIRDQVVAAYDDLTQSVIQSAEILNERSDFEGEAPDRLYRLSLDVRVWAPEP